MKIKLLSIVAFLLITTSLFGQVKQTDAKPVSKTPSSSLLLEEVKRTGDELIIPYKRYQLKNGLTILIHEDHSDPICYVDVTYHVGSQQESNKAVLALRIFLNT